MSPDQFNTLLGQVIDNTTATLGQKSKDYARGGDKLHNFKRAAAIGETTPAKALLGMMLKHETSVRDIVDDLEGGQVHAPEHLQEKFGDIINYYILLYAVVLEETANA